MKFTFKKIMIFLVVVLMVVFIFVSLNPQKSAQSSVSTFAKVSSGSTSNAVSAPVVIGYGNLANELSNNYLVKALPENSIIVLKFYNFNSGARQWEKSYVLTTGNAVEGDSASADIVLSLHSKYLSQLNRDNFCSVIQTANANRDLGFESSLSTISLAWKFKSIMQYKSCFGM